MYIALIIKATRLCNLRCEYCHDWRSGPDNTMTFEVLASLIYKALKDPKHQTVDFIWHGGEPTILNKNFFEKVLYLQANYKRPDQIIKNSIQTNGTMLTDEWLYFLNENDFNVGISLDGPPEIHNRKRPNAGNKPTFNLVWESLQRIKAHQIPTTVLMVIDKEALQLGAESIFNFFVENDIKSFALIACKPNNYPDAKPGTPANNYTSPPEMSQFLIDMYHTWKANGDTTIRIREIHSLINRILQERPGICTLAGGCLGKYFLIEPDGEVAHCDLFMGDSNYTFGNIVSQTFEDIRNSENLCTLEEANRENLEKMKICSEFSTCNGWCPHESYISLRHNPSHDPFCCGLKKLIQHLRRDLIIDQPESAILYHDKNI